MVKFIPSLIQLDAEILRLLETISRQQGTLAASKLTIEDYGQIEKIAAIDAIHFSTKIEGNLLTRDQVTAALHSKLSKVSNPAKTRDLKEILNYSRVRRMVREWSLKEKPLNDDWVRLHHAGLLKQIVKGKLSGHYRNAQCAIQDSKTHQIIFMAAEWGDVPLLMKGLLLWLRQQLKTQASPLLVAAQFHFEFVTIHPFMDGNGRLARLLTNGILLAGGYDVEGFASLEKQHELTRQEYYRALRTLQASNFYDIPTGQNIRSWVLYWLNCLHKTYSEALDRLTEVGAHSSLKINPYGEDQRLTKAGALFSKYPKLKASDYADLMGLGRTQAVDDLNRLIKDGLIEKTDGGRSTFYQRKKKSP